MRQMKGRICRTGGRVHGGRGWDRWENTQQERVGQVGEYTVGEGGIWLVNIG
ncbi:hypothetical protein C354_00890 [Cryptococcus neoformans MW-RSA1955]|nr:hypothetical protein C354_00890 [Cryptococcus neoformans var. grubii MW-RSA1955]